ncbi:mucin-associated surface protein (MASP), putative [Trypanosoma cruzi marinkellei]|uniref:Mucin-associated surface protein (MASP), putative n=1 Tax=Trypanosoma cruzi marinkellei TaxID=85056 RepID=K2NHH1_TRYCR|nr:mucin-associated surface protein (MASP), putative [Trypanosoma cruzi marinkellei]
MLLQLLFVAVPCLLLLSLCVDWELVCAEGYTQVTGVMAMMMMTGRVLLVCALCVLWCGTAGVHARDGDKNALCGCMASGVLGANGSNMSSWCNKTGPTLPLRSVLPIIAAEVLADENDSDQTVIDSGSRSSEELSILPPAALSDVSVASGGGGSSGGGGGGCGGKSGVFNLLSPGSGGGSQLGNDPLKADSSGVLYPPPTLEAGNALKSSGVRPSTQSRDSQTIIEQPSEIKTPPITTPPKVEVFERPKAELEHQVANTHEKANSQVTCVNANENNTDKRGVRNEEIPSIVLSLDSTPPVKLPTPPPPLTPEAPPPKASPEATAPEIGEGSPAPKPLQEPTEQTNDNLQLQNKTEYEALKQPSVDAETPQRNQESDTSTLAKITDDGSRAETAAPSISIDYVDDAKSTGDENNDNAERPNPKETSEYRADNTNDVPTASETAPQTARTAIISQTNDTATKGDGDSSTAVSHTTSPLLLLLLVAAAAAAVVVAA